MENVTETTTSRIKPNPTTYGELLEKLKPADRVVIVIADNDPNDEPWLDADTQARPRVLVKEERAFVNGWKEHAERLAGTHIWVRARVTATIPDVPNAFMYREQSASA